jgi:hypothetical protein
MAPVRRMRCISIHPVQECRSDGEDRAMKTGDFWNASTKPAQVQIEGLARQRAPRRARVARQAGSVVLRIDDLSISAVVRGGRELLPFVGGIKASQPLFWQPENFWASKRMLSKAV